MGRGGAACLISRCLWVCNEPHDEVTVLSPVTKAGGWWTARGRHGGGRQLIDEPLGLTYSRPTRAGSPSQRSIVNLWSPIFCRVVLDLRLLPHIGKGIVYPQGQGNVNEF